ncbi:hypothetical protein EYC59_03730 [Candidatus Saccharibacteria bacterium]|nr:MAG: hypothetical protein EYC59_03730 [Candidatus Saccharibacteria bacterium]
MRGRAANTVRRLIVLGLFVTVMAASGQTVLASPFGQGVFGADVPFGSATSLAIALGGNVSLNLTPNGSNFEGSGSHTITVTSTDVVGYELYIYASGSTAMSNGTDTIPASANASPSSLAVNTWGYNTTGSTTNFKGITTTPTVFKTALGPYKSGDNTTVTYGVLTNITKSSGAYTSNVTYTAVALTQ